MQKGILENKKEGNRGKKKCGEWVRMCNSIFSSAR
jgi:hypothetical protein